MIYYRCKDLNHPVMILGRVASQLLISCEGTNKMLRIDIHDGVEATSFTLEGKLMGPWVAELENCWRTAITTEPIKGDSGAVSRRDLH